MNPSNPPIRVAIVEDRPISLQNLKRMFSTQSTIQVLFDASNGKALQAGISRDGCPDVVLLDVAMPEMDGYATARWLREFYPKVRIITSSYYTEPDLIKRMLGCGAHGYLPKESATEEVCRAVREVIEKGVLLNEYVSAEMLREVDARTSPYEVEQLNDRQVELLRLLCSDDVYEVIADKMRLSIHTVKRYASELNAIFGVHSRPALLTEARRLGLLPIDWQT